MTGAARRQLADPTVYPVVQEVPESREARLIANQLWTLVERWLAERGETALVGGDQFIYYRQHDPHRRVAPDVYVLPGVPPGTAVGAWKVWESGIVPSFAVEVVSLDVRKDYEIAPERYQELGARELVIFDPDFEEGPDRIRLQVYRRKSGRLTRILATNADRVRSRVLGCWLRSVGSGTDVRLRLATGPRGDDLYPTGEEAERHARELAEAELARLRSEPARRR
jgi:Uma2 family endonuclease